MEVKSLLVIAHAGLNQEISDEEIEKALPKNITGNRKTVHIRLGRNRLTELYELDFEQLAFEQTREYQNQIRKWIEENPDGVIAYFGLVPLALSIHLGYTIGNFSHYWIFQRHHTKKEWYRSISENDEMKFKLEAVHTMDRAERGKGDVMIRISSSYLIDEHQSLRVLQDPIKEFDIKLKHLDPDIFTSQQQIEEVADAFYRVLNTISNYLPNSGSIHIISAIPCGLAFLLGTKVNPNVTPRIVTYQFDRSEDPIYKEALVISKEISNEAPLTDKDIKAANTLRREWGDSLKREMIPFIKSVDSSKSWHEVICESNSIEESIFQENSFFDLPSLSRLSLSSDEISMKEKTVEGGFTYSFEKSSWYLDDGFLAKVKSRASKKEFDTKRAGRLFLLHEALHYCKEGHNLIQENAEGIGRFPKVIEDADYQADVYAMLNDWKIAKLYDSEATENVKSYFMNSIEAAVETMWSFIDNGDGVSQFQIRSMNRLLNWYWQYVMIEKVNTGTNQTNEVLKILLKKPTIEIAGLDMRLIGHRIYYLLNDKSVGNRQMASFHNNKVYRFMPNNMDAIIQGFRKLDGELIKKGMRSFVANL